MPCCIGPVLAGAARTRIELKKSSGLAKQAACTVGQHPGSGAALAGWPSLVRLRLRLVGCSAAETADPAPAAGCFCLRFIDRGLGPLARLRLNRLLSGAALASSGSCFRASLRSSASLGCRERVCSCSSGQASECRASLYSLRAGNGGMEVHFPWQWGTDGQALRAD